MVLERFNKNIKGQKQQDRTANNGKSYFGYLNMLGDEYNNSCHPSINKKPNNAGRS